MGAGQGRGGGRALIGVLRGADAIVFCHDASAPPEELGIVLAELEAAGVEKPSLVAATKADEAGPEALARAFPKHDVLGVSVLDDESLDALCEAVWKLTGLARVFLRSAGELEPEPVALHPPVTVVDVADSIHHELGARCIGARLWGPSARFEGQRVGRDHELADGDAVEILD